MDELDLISGINSLLSQSVKIYWDGNVPKNDKTKIITTIVNNPDKFIKDRNINLFKKFEIENFEHGINIVKKLYEYYNQKDFDNSVIKMDSIDNNSPLFLIIYKR